MTTKKTKKKTNKKTVAEKKTVVTKVDVDLVIGYLQSASLGVQFAIKALGEFDAAKNYVARLNRMDDRLAAMVENRKAIESINSRIERSLNAGERKAKAIEKKKMLLAKLEAELAKLEA